MAKPTVGEVVDRHNAGGRAGEIAQDPKNGCQCVDCADLRSGKAHEDDEAQGDGN